MKGRWIEPSEASDSKKTEVDQLIDQEIDLAYKRAIDILTENSTLHHILIDAMMKFKTLGEDTTSGFLCQIPYYEKI